MYLTQHVLQKGISQRKYSVARTIYFYSLLLCFIIFLGSSVTVFFFLRVKKSTRCNITKYMVWQSLSCSRIPAEFLHGAFLWWPATATGGDKPHHFIPFVQDKDLGSVAGKPEWSWIFMLSMNIQESWIFMLSCTLGEWETEARDIWEEQSDWGAEWEDQRADWAKSEVRSERIWCVCIYKGYLAHTRLGITGGCPFSRMEMFWFFFVLICYF